MFGVAADFRSTHGEAAFRLLAATAFSEADVDQSGAIDTQELQATLLKLGIDLSDEQAADVISTYDQDGNNELDETEFVKLVSELIDGSAKLPTGSPALAAANASGGSGDDSPLAAENAKLKAANKKLAARVQLLESQLKNAGITPYPEPKAAPPPVADAGSSASRAAAAAARAGTKPGNPGKEVKRKCPTCLHTWIDKYFKAECPKCLSPLPTDGSLGALRVMRAPGESAPILQRQASSAMESEGGECGKGGAHTFRFGKCSKCGIGEGAFATSRMKGGECPKGGKHVFKFEVCVKCGGKERER